MDNTETTTQESIETVSNEVEAMDVAGNDFNTAEPVEENVATKQFDLSTPAKEEEKKEDYSWVPAKFKNKETGEPEFEKLAKSYAYLEKKLGQAAEIPDEPDGYQYEFKAFEADEKASADFKKAAHDMGFTQPQYDFIMSVYEKMVESGIQAPEKTIDILQKDWGDAYEANLTYANQAIDAYMPKGESIAKYPHLANDPLFAKIMANIGKELQEDTVSQNVRPNNVGFSKLQIQEMMSAPDYWQNKEKQRIVSQWYSQGNRARD